MGTLVQKQYAISWKCSLQRNNSVYIQKIFRIARYIRKELSDILELSIFWKLWNVTCKKKNPYLFWVKDTTKKKRKNCHNWPSQFHGWTPASTPRTSSASILSIKPKCNSSQMKIGQMETPKGQKKNQHDDKWSLKTGYKFHTHLHHCGFL